MCVIPVNLIAKLFIDIAFIRRFIIDKSIQNIFVKHIKQSVYIIELDEFVCSFFI